MGATLFVLAAILLTTTSIARAERLKIATLAPDGTLWMNRMREGAAEIEKRTAGRVTIKFYPGGVMGSDKTVRRKIRVGQLHGGAITSGVLYDVYHDTQLYSLPMVFRSYNDADFVRARMDKDIVGGLEKGGFVTFGFSEGGFAYLMSKEPVRSMEDLKSRKVWVPEGDPVTREMFVAMGITPIPLPIADVYTGLQTGLIDTIGTSPIGAIAFQWHTQVKYVTDVPLIYLYGMLAMDRDTFAKLAAADQAVVREVMTRVFDDLNRQNRVEDVSAKTALKKQGLEFVALSTAEYRSLEQKVADARVELAKRDIYSVAGFERMQKYLDTFRKSKGLAAR
jgi:TRAP-type C4-dicarboxylate transport system substrate-binding protein